MLASTQTMLKGFKIEVSAFLQIWANGKVYEKYENHVKELVYLGYVRDTAGHLSFTQKGDVILDSIFSKLDRMDVYIKEVLEFNESQ
jgi:coproporphyrinogen III oxidase-like Fe-S oxidoreductase